MVDPSLLRLAADRGVTICFADLDGADGLWVPEERTVLVSRRLSEHEVAEVIEHELGHVAIDDQHADLDAGVLRSPPAPSHRWAAALTAAACLALVGGVTAGLSLEPGTPVRESPVVAPSAPPLTAPLPGPDESIATQAEIGPDGRVVIRTITLTTTPTAVAAPATTTAGRVAPTRTGSTSARPAPPPAASPTSPAATSPPPTVTTPPTTPASTTDPPSSAPAAVTEGALPGDSAQTGAP